MFRSLLAPWQSYEDSEPASTNAITNRLDVPGSSHGGQSVAQGSMRDMVGELKTTETVVAKTAVSFA